jgi:hypothetical protein
MGVRRWLLPFSERRNCVLDLIVIVVTIVTFIAFIGFTEGCERL